MGLRKPVSHYSEHNHDIDMADSSQSSQNTHYYSVDALYVGQPAILAFHVHVYRNGVGYHIQSTWH